ncbi:tryptophan--tRNA ligase [Niameybacter massiliensis]|uniref:Tryptophan--tRNA ligase n=1 Tax=Holtiella tumoricola TaxID=3018743 RepID=A0AA42DMU8_9FIRM|nr:tryptophan--tRNA ligase [Holtiella tumoricola]MDA3731873.1 tryptophan--tRNA ligase [Holtiella tumoricola]
MENKKRILTGDRTTGRLHLGHYVGSLQNRVKLQNDYETFILLADIQALTTHFKNPSMLKDSIYQVAIDNLSVGLDPNKVTFVQQSQIAAIAELTVFYSMFVPVNVLRHNPTVKAEAAQYGYDDLTYGFLGYPVSQAADITFCHADLVPVGEDQLPHMELTRKIVRRFNDLYGHGESILREPDALLSETPRFIGLDGGSKMGKSLGNAIYLSDSQEVIKQKINGAVTDPNRIRITDLGNPDICSVSQYHKAFNPGEYNNICDMCRSGKIGCVACKKQLGKALNDILEPVQTKRAYYEEHLDEVKEIVQTGSDKANQIGNETVRQIKEAMNIHL